MSTALTLALGLATFTYQMGFNVNAALREQAERRAEQAEARTAEAESERDEALRALHDQEAGSAPPTSNPNPTPAPTAASPSPTMSTPPPAGASITGAAPQVSVAEGASANAFDGALRVGVRFVGDKGQMTVSTAAAECDSNLAVGQSVALAGGSGLWYRVTLLKKDGAERAVDLLLEQYTAQPPASQTCEVPAQE